MRTNPRLEIPDDPDRNIWAYISIMKVTPVIMDDFLLVILTIYNIFIPITHYKSTSDEEELYVRYS